MNFCNICCQVNEKQDNYYYYIYYTDTIAIAIPQSLSSLIFLMGDETLTNIIKIQIESPIFCPHNELFLNAENTRDLLHLIKNHKNLWRSYLEELWKK